jgi:Family of unknown function (DUF5994)
MTTIRVTRRPRTSPEGVEGTATRSAAVPPVGAGEDAVRLALIDPPAPRTTLDGAWWPRTRSLTQELPALIEELHRRGLRMTRAAYQPDSWDPAPRRLPADDRVIRLGWFRSIDPQLLNLTGDLRRARLDLLVIPPDTPAAVARQAFAAATDRANRCAPTALLGALGPAGLPSHGADVHD